MGNGGRSSSAAARSATKRTSAMSWKWIVFAAVAALVLIQIAHGVFVQSVTAPGGGSISFFPPQADRMSSGNIVDQERGAYNRASIAGKDNVVRQIDGLHNTAIVNGVGNSIDQR
jgi:hypothetical protein